QYAATHVRNDFKIIGDDQVVDHGLQNLVHVAQGREQTDFLQMVQCVIFRWPLPHALRLDWSSLASGVSLILDGVDLNVREFLIVLERLRIVAPEASLSLEMQAGEQGADTFEIRLPDEDIRRQ